MENDVIKFIKKSKQWPEEMLKLRSIITKVKLEENLKWGQPCYSHSGNNIVIIQPFKNFLAMMFFKGSLLKDTKKLLIANGPNSQAAKRFEFRSLGDITKNGANIAAYIKEAIALEESGKKVEFKKKSESIPAELKTIFGKNPKFKTAFEALTPGRQRAYLLFFNGAKQSATRVARIEKYISRILEGKGINDR